MTNAVQTRERLARAGQLAGVGALYVVTARLGLELDAVSGFATLVWPPTGIALAAVVLLGARIWPAIAVGAFVANVVSGAPLAVAAGIATGNALEAVVAAVLLRRVAGFDPALARIRDIVALVVAAAAISTLVSATVGVTSLWAGGVIESRVLAGTWRAWWVGDALGDLVVAPVLLAWLRAPRRRRSGRALVEACVVAAITIAITLYMFGAIVPAYESGAFRSPYLVFPVLVWAALRFGPIGAATGTFLVWVVAIVVTSLGHGPFAAGRLSESLLPLQVFMAVVALTMLFLAAAASERDHAARQASHAIRARDEFLAVASHELRTPLTSLGLQVANVRDLLRAGAPADVLGARLDIVERQGDRLAALVESLLDVSRIMAGRFELADEEVDLRAIVRDVAARFRDQAQKAGSELTVEDDDGGPATLRSDRMRLEQVLGNLLGNALRHGAGKPVRIRLTASLQVLTIAIRDHGGGIDPSDHARIFERFERAGARAPAGGLGLGLWIVRQIVLSMGGAVSVRSEVGCGAEFEVTLPRARPDAT